MSLVLVVALVVVVVTGQDMTRSSIIAYALRQRFVAHGLPAAWGEVFGLTETLLRPSVVTTAGDGARGGSYGPTCISRQTARAWGYTGRMEALNEDPFLAAELTAAMVAAGFGEHGGQLVADRYVWNEKHDSAYAYGFPSNLDDALSIWNAGVPYASAPSSTLAYVKRARTYLAQVEA